MIKMPSEKPKRFSKNIGKYRRKYDNFMGETEEGKLLAEILNLPEDAIPIIPEPANNAMNILLEWAGSAFRMLSNVVANSYYAVRDLIKRKRVKSSLTLLGSIGLGAGIGFVIGSIIFPGVGSAVGLAFGAIGGGLAPILTGVGLAVIGAAVGDWLANKVIPRWFKKENTFELSYRITKNLKNKFGLSAKTCEKMNCYLYNREKSIDSLRAKGNYRALRNNGILHGNVSDMSKIVHFFCQELLLLELEKASYPQSPNSKQRAKDIRAVISILREFNNPKMEVHAETANRAIIEYEQRQDNKFPFPEDVLPKIQENYRLRPEPKPEFKQEIERLEHEKLSFSPIQTTSPKLRGKSEIDVNPRNRNSPKPGGSNGPPFS